MAYNQPVRNDAKGIGSTVLDYSADFGSAGRLQSFIDLNTLSQYPEDPTAHIATYNHNLLTLIGEEWGHRFLAFTWFRKSGSLSSLLLGRDSAHWNYFFNSEASVEAGNEWRDDGGGHFTVTDDTRRYSRLDQYLMGLRPPEDVGPLMIVTDPQPIASGTIESFLSAYGLINNAIRDSRRDFGAIDRLFGFNLHVGDYDDPYSGSWSYYGAFIRHSSQTETGPAPGVLTTAYNLQSTFGAKLSSTYSVRKERDSMPASRYFDESTGQFTGENLTFDGTRFDLTLDQIIEAEGERSPAFGEAQTNFRHAFALIVPRGKEASADEIRRLASVRKGWEAFYGEATEGRGSVSTAATFGFPKVSALLAPGASRLFASQGTASSPTSGYARLDPGQEPVSGVAILSSRSGNQVVGEAAVPGTGTVKRARCFAEKSDVVNTGLAIAAPAGAAVLSLELRDSAGAVKTSEPLSIPAGGQVARFLTEFFPSFGIPANFQGSLTLTSSVPVSVVTLRTIQNQAGEFLLTSMPLADLDAVPTPAPLYLPQIATRGGYATEILLVNPGASELGGTVDFLLPGGTPMTVNVNGVSGSTFQYRLAPHGAQVLATRREYGDALTGYAILNAQLGQPAPITGAVFTLEQTNLLVAATGVAPAAASTHIRLVVDRSSGHDAGVAIVNPGKVKAALQLRAAGASGAACATATLSLDAGNRMSQFVSEVIPDLPAGFHGTLDVTSDVPVATLAMRSTNSGSRFLLATLPVDDLTQHLVARVLYFPHFADSGGFSSQFVVVNLGSGSTEALLSFLSQQGAPQPLVAR